MEDSSEMYEVLVSDGAGKHQKLGFRLLADALRCARAYQGRGSVAIRRPDGQWHQWDKEQTMASNRRTTPRLPTRAACVLQLTPGRRDAQRADETRRRSSVLDAGPGGARVLIGGVRARLHRGDPVAFGVSFRDGELTLPARVAWSSGEKVGLTFRMPSGEVESLYLRWLEHAAIDALDTATPG